MASWIFLIVMFDLYRTNWLGYIILALPLFVFYMAFISVAGITRRVESSIFQANYIAVSLLVIIPFMIFLSQNFRGDKHRFITLIILAVVLTLGARLDLWISEYYLPLVHHGQSVLQTMGLALLLFSIYLYYVEAVSDKDLDTPELSSKIKS